MVGIGHVNVGMYIVTLSRAGTLFITRDGRILEMRLSAEDAAVVMA